MSVIGVAQQWHEVGAGDWRVASGASSGDRGKLGVGRLILSKTDVLLYIDKVLLMYCECGCSPGGSNKCARSSL